ncbi:Integrase core domain-containing protein, partial [bacterium A37T11]
RNTVNTYMQLFAASEYSPGELLRFDTAALSELFSSHTTVDTARHNELMLYFEGVNKARNHPGFTFLHHYQQYMGQSREPYSYTQFLEHYQRKYPKEKGSMKLEHVAGEEMFIDFAGKKLHITDKETGELIAVEVFVAILPCSHYTFVQACNSQKREELIACCANALHFFGGVPQAVISDNLKSAVNRASKYEADINRSFKDFARHYNCVINPTRGYSPQDKASVERQYLKPLPGTAYELKDYRRAKVQKMGYVYISPDKSYYSVPHRYIGKETLIHYTKSRVEVFHNQQRIALHQRNLAKGSYITDKDHLGSTHRFYSDWNPEFFKRKAAPHGEHVLKCVENILA